jgi:hypothetical protein
MYDFSTRELTKAVIDDFLRKFEKMVDLFKASIVYEEENEKKDEENRNLTLRA